MLSNRSRAVTSKQVIMAENMSLSSPKQTRPPPISSFLCSPRILSGFLATNNLSDIETLASPKSILPGSNFGSNPFGYQTNQPKPAENLIDNNNYSCEKLDPKGIGLALIDEKSNDRISRTSGDSNSRRIVFGSKLKVQIPSLQNLQLTTADSPKSPADFGIKTRNSQLMGSPSPFGLANSGLQSTDYSTRTLSGSLSLTEMELSEDYTCVISHGPNPKTTHIYDNCIVESCCGVVGMSELERELGISSENQKPMSANFLGSCHTCKKMLGEGRDVYMYRGETAFCSHECRSREIIFGARVKCSLD